MQKVTKHQLYNELDFEANNDQAITMLITRHPDFEHSFIDCATTILIETLSECRYKGKKRIAFAIHHLDPIYIAGALEATASAIKCLCKSAVLENQCPVYGGLFNYNGDSEEKFVLKTEFLLFESPEEAHAYMSLISSPEFNIAYHN